MIESFIVAVVVGVMEVEPGRCQVELLNPDQTIDTTLVSCYAISPTYEPLP